MKLNECVALNCKMTLTIMHTKCHQEFDNVLSQGSTEAENILSLSKYSMENADHEAALL